MALAVIGATLIDSGIPAIRTLMAVGTDVPYWVGTTAKDHVIRLRVPPGLQTTSFKLKPPAIAAAVTSAREQAHEQLAALPVPGGLQRSTQHYPETPTHAWRRRTHFAGRRPRSAQWRCH